MTARNRWLVITGRFTTAFGAILLAIYAGAALHRVVSSRLALREFDRAQTFVRPEPAKTPFLLLDHRKVDFSLWSEGRVTAYNKNLRERRKVRPWPFCVSRG